MDEERLSPKSRVLRQAARELAEQHSLNPRSNLEAEPAEIEAAKQQLVKLLQFLFVESDRGAEVSDEEAIVALVESRIVTPVEDPVEGPSSQYRFMLSDRGQNILPTLAMYAHSRTSFRTSKTKVVQGLREHSIPAAAAARYFQYPSFPAPFIEPSSVVRETLSVEADDRAVSYWRRWAARLTAIIGRLLRRKVVSVQDPTEAESLEKGLDRATDSVDAALNYLGPPPEGSASMFIDVPKAPVGVS